MKKVLFGIFYWLGQLTWGILMTLIGLIASVICLVFIKGSKAHRNGYSFIIEVGGNWGGVSLGAISLCGHYSETDIDWFEHTRKHEAGHSLQNLIFGPLFTFVVAIPSACRYWYDVYCANHGRYLDNDWYESAWFEHTATLWGTWYVQKVESKVK